MHIDSSDNTAPHLLFMRDTLRAHHILKTALVPGNAGGTGLNFCASDSHIVSHYIWGSQRAKQCWILATLFSVATELFQICSLICFKVESVDKESQARGRKWLTGWRALSIAN